MTARILALVSALAVMQALPARAEAFSLCRFHKPVPDEALVYAAEIYSGAASNWRGPLGVVKVAVNSPERPVVLLLAAAESTLWHVGWTEGTEILAVAATGYGRQIVIGPPPETEILISSPARGSERVCPYARPPSAGDRGGWPRDQRLRRVNGEGLNQISQLLTGRPPEGRFGLTESGRLLFGPLIPGGQPVFTARELRRADFDLNWPLDDFLLTAIRQKRLRPAGPRDFIAWVRAKNRASGRADEAVALPDNLAPDRLPRPAWAYLVLDPDVLPALAELLPSLDDRGGGPLIFFLPPGLETPEPAGRACFLSLTDGAGLGRACSGARLGGLSLK